ncbi:MAG TPA: co-chaperone GroES [Candidatus Paceibacterota bacterium]|nr:co-chaperone GroES [Candidatus Paceibacterota bacterium]
MAPKSSIGVEPLGDRVLVRPMEAETVTASGFVIPENAKKEKPERGEVVAVGAGRRADDGSLIPMRVAIGDIVMFSKYGFDEIEVGGVTYVIVSEPSILAILSS